MMDVITVLKTSFQLAKLARASMRAIGLALHGIQKLRLQDFLRGCRQSMHEQGDLSGRDIKRFLHWVKSPGGSRLLFDFISGATNTGSEIARVTLGRVFFYHYAKSLRYSGYEYTVAFRALRDLDDNEALLFANLFCIHAQFNSQFASSLSIRPLPKETLFSLPEKSFNDYSRYFPPSCAKYADVLTITNEFKTRRMVQPQGTVFDQAPIEFFVTEFSLLLMEDMRWGASFLKYDLFLNKEGN